MKPNLQLHPLSNWEQFEDLCFFLWKDIWGDPNTHKNGRRGQSQNGVDIFGCPRFSNDYVGVQCKGKNGNYGSVLTTKEVEQECNNARSFMPPLKSFIMATTSPRDQALQAHCRKLSSHKTYNFTVDAWFWDDIEEEVLVRPAIMEKFYPGITESVVLNRMVLSPDTPLSKLQSFFSRPHLFKHLNRYAITFLYMVAQELVTNAFEHGHASFFSIEAERDRLICCDNGKPFNPCSLIPQAKVGRGGSLTLKLAAETYELSYNYKNEEGCDAINVFIIDTTGVVSESDPSEPYYISISSDEIFGRSHSQQIAFKEFQSIPPEAESIVIDICGKFNMCASSNLGLFDTLQKLLSPKQKVRIYLPFGYFSDFIIEHYKADQRMEFIPKH